MFLRPQHFQAAERHRNEVAHTSEQWDHQYGYGLRSIEISPEAISNSQFEIQSLRARMRDGTIISIGPELNRVDLKEAFAKESTVKIFLAVPQLTSTGANVGDAEASAYTRYTAVEESVTEEAAGGNDQLIEFRKPNVQLVDSTRDMPGFELLPIAQLNRAAGGEAVPQLDPLYIPPVIAVDGWTNLERDYVRAIFDMIGTKIDLVAQQVRNRGITLASQEPGDLERIFMLRILNEASAVLKVLTFAQGVHPLTAYSELCRTAGMLAIFGPERTLDDVPAYDHDDLGRIFEWVRSRIAALLAAVQEDQFEQRFFTGVIVQGTSGRYPRMQVDMEAKWLGPDWDLYVGIKVENAPLEVARDLLVRPGYIDLKMGSAERVDAMFAHRAEGVRFNQLEQVPRALPLSNDWIYYEVIRNSAEWQHVFNSKTLALRFNERLIESPEELQGKNKLIVNVQKRKVGMELSVFAVRRASGGGVK